MVSEPEVNRRLQQFICVRLDWEQMQRHKGRLQTPTQGNQVLLDPEGKHISGLSPRGARYEIQNFLRLLDRVAGEFPADPEHGDDLQLEWFLWNPRQQGLPNHFDAAAVSKLDRKPVLTLSGPIPSWLREPQFLRRHLREFIWTRGAEDGPARLTIRQYEPAAKELLSVSLPATRPEDLGDRLDAAWLQYMKERPLVARGYIDNPFGKWLKGVMERAHEEETDLREQARKGTLKPPGR